MEELGPMASVQTMRPWGEELVGKASDLQAPCEDALEGSNCFNAVMWLKRGGFGRHPEWYPEYSAESSFQDVQAMLNASGKSHCPRPCATASAARRPPRDAGRDALEGGRCRDAVKGDHCFRAITWFMAKGIAAHPEWYPSLDANSTSYEVQGELNRQGKAECPRPCTEGVRRDQAEARHEQEQAQEPQEPQEPQCHTSVEGDECFREVVWAMRTGIVQHPSRYLPLTSSSSFEDFQRYLRGTARLSSICPEPCAEERDRDEKAAHCEPWCANWSSGRTDEDAWAMKCTFKGCGACEACAVPARPVAESEKPNPMKLPSYGMRYEHLKRAALVAGNCEDAEIHSECYAAVQHTLTEGIRRHPDDYPNLPSAATFRDVQENLFLRGRARCPRPCPKAAPGGAKPHRRRLEDMTLSELDGYLDGQWDGVVQPDPGNDRAWMDAPPNATSGAGEAEGLLREIFGQGAKMKKVETRQAAVETRVPASTSTEEQAKVQYESTTTAHVEAQLESTTTAHVETKEEMEARIKTKVMRAMADAKAQLESTTTAHVETEEEMEARIKTKVMRAVADAKAQLESTTTAHVETEEEMEARIKTKVMRAVADAKAQLESSTTAYIETRAPMDTSAEEQTPANASEEARAPADSSAEEQTPANASEEARAPADTSAEEHLPANGSEAFEEAQVVVKVREASSLPMVDMDGDLVKDDDDGWGSTVDQTSGRAYYRSPPADETRGEPGSQEPARAADADAVQNAPREAANDDTAMDGASQEEAAANATASDGASPQAADVTASDGAPQEAATAADPVSVSQEEAANVTAPDGAHPDVIAPGDAATAADPDGVSQEAADVIAPDVAPQEGTANDTASDVSQSASRAVTADAAVDAGALEPEAAVAKDPLPMVDPDGAGADGAEAPAEAAPTARPRRRRRRHRPAESTTTAHVETAEEVEARVRAKVMRAIAGAKAQLESTTTAHAETAEEMEARVRARVMRAMAGAKAQLESTATADAQTEEEEAEARIQAKVMRAMADAKAQLESTTPADVEPAEDLAA